MWGEIEPALDDFIIATLDFMSSGKKQLLFIIVGILIISLGVLTILAVNNRGAGPVAWWNFDLPC